MNGHSSEPKKPELEERFYSNLEGIPFKNYLAFQGVVWLSLRFECILYEII